MDHIVSDSKHFFLSFSSRLMHRYICSFEGNLLLWFLSVSFCLNYIVLQRKEQTSRPCLVQFVCTLAWRSRAKRKLLHIMNSTRVFTRTSSIICVSKPVDKSNCLMPRGCVLLWDLMSVLGILLLIAFYRPLPNNELHIVYIRCTLTAWMNCIFILYVSVEFYPVRLTCCVRLPSSSVIL